MTPHSSEERVLNEQEVSPRQWWQALRLRVGFNLTEMISGAVSMTDTRVRCMAVCNVLNLLETGCQDGHRWQEAIETLNELLREHTDAHKESGSWHDGASSILALAAAKEAATCAFWSLYPSVYRQDEIDACAYKVFKYLLRALVQHPDSAVSCLKWVERVIHL